MEIGQNKRVLLEFAKLWRQKFGRSYPISWGKENAAIKRLLDQFPEDELLSYMRYFLTAYIGRFAERSGYSLFSFSAELPAIVSQVAEEEKKRAATAAGNADFERIADARKKLGGQSED